MAYIGDKTVSVRDSLKRTLLSRQPKERKFPNEQAEYDTELCCLIIEQAVMDWIRLDYGKIGRIHGEGGTGFIYRAEVEAFFHSLWFETLLLFALPNYTPKDIRLAIHVPEWERGD